MARIVGIDLGSYSVKVVRLETRGRGGFEVIGYGEALLPAVDGAAHTDLPARHSAALAELKEQGHLEGDVFVTGVPGDAAAVRTLRFPFSDPRKIADALPFALESEISLDLDDIVISWTLLGPTSRGQKDGTGETEVMVAFVRKEVMQGLLELLAAHGIDPRHVEFDALALDDLFDSLFASSWSTRPETPHTPGGTLIEVGDGAPAPATAIVDIGHRRTTVCVLAGNRVVSAHSILHGGADATRALSKAIGLPLIEAERGKRKEAFIEVTGARAQFPEQAQISEVLKTAYAPIVRRLRQVFQATISTSRVRVVKVLLVGGGSQILNLDRHLAEELNIHVVRGQQVAQTMRTQLALERLEDGAPEAALALSYALSGIQGSKTRARLDFRTAEFAWKGDFEFVRERAPALAVWAAVLMVLLVGSGMSSAFVLATTESDLVKQELALCKEITGVEQDSFTRCMALIQERIQGQATFQVPERSAADTYLEIARRLPAGSELRRKVNELDVTPERVKIRGVTQSYEAIDTMVERLQGGKCFSVVEKGKAQNKGTDVEFNIAITLDCATAPGDGKEPKAVAASAASPTPTGSVAPAPASLPPAPVSSPPPPPSPPPGQSRSAAQAGVSSFADEAEGGDGQVERGDGDGAAGKRAGRLTPEQIEQRRERLQKLREERELRRASRMGVDSLNNLGVRPLPGRDKMRLRAGDGTPAAEVK